MTRGVEPGMVKMVKREQLARIVEGMVQGLAASYSVARDMEPAPEFLGICIGNMIRRHILTDGTRFNNGRERAKKKYRFL